MQRSKAVFYSQFQRVQSIMVGRESEVGPKRRGRTEERGCFLIPVCSEETKEVTVLSSLPVESNPHNQD